MWSQTYRLLQIACTCSGYLTNPKWRSWGGLWSSRSDWTSSRMPSIRVNYGSMLTLLFCTRTRGLRASPRIPPAFRPPVSEAWGTACASAQAAGSRPGLHLRGPCGAGFAVGPPARPASAVRLLGGSWDLLGKGSGHTRGPRGALEGWRPGWCPRGQGLCAEWPGRGGRSRCLRGHTRHLGLPWQRPLPDLALRVPCSFYCLGESR